MGARKWWKLPAHFRSTFLFFFLPTSLPPPSPPLPPQPAAAHHHAARPHFTPPRHPSLHPHARGRGVGADGRFTQAKFMSGVVLYKYVHVATNSGLQSEYLHVNICFCTGVSEKAARLFFSKSVAGECRGDTINKFLQPCCTLLRYLHDIIILGPWGRCRRARLLTIVICS